MRKAQVALEFITTYGWALMVLVAMVGALAYFGVFNTQKYIPDRCVVGEGFTCVDYRLTTWDSVCDSEVTFILQNTLGRTVTITERVEIRYGDTIGNANCGMFNWYDWRAGGPDNRQSITLAPGEKVEVSCNPGTGASIVFPGVGEKERVRFSFNYTIEGGVFKHLVEGEIIATVQSQQDGLLGSC